MKRALAAFAMFVCLSSVPHAIAGILFSYEQAGSTIANDCPPGFPPQPICADIVATGDANDVPDVIPGHWIVTLQGRVLNFVGSGTFLFDDPSPADNDFFGTWTNVLFPPDASGVAHTTFDWIVTGGTGIFAGLSGRGTSEGDVVIVPAPVAACDRAQPGLGSFCDAGQFHIPEPATLLLLGFAMAAALSGRRRQRGR